MATSWGASAGELTATATPTGFGLSSQPSAAAVDAAHADVAAFTANLATRLDMRAKHVADANTRHVAGEGNSTNELATLAVSPTVV